MIFAALSRSTRSKVTLDVWIYFKIFTHIETFTACASSGKNGKNPFYGYKKKKKKMCEISDAAGEVRLPGIANDKLS